MTLVLLLLGLAACDRPCRLDADLVPGCGLRLGEASLRLGDDPAAFSLSESQDLGEMGARFSLADGPVTGRAEDGAVVALTVHAGYEGRTAEGVGIGDAADAVRGALGDPVVDPFVGAWWYRERGACVEWEDGRVARVQVFHAE